MPRSKPIFIVEGDLEKEFLQKHCDSKSIIRKIPSNGRNVPVDRLAEMVIAILEAIRNPTRVFVIVDREGRDISSSVLEESLLNRLTELGAQGSISVHVPDRMIENWILADHDACAAEHLDVDLPGSAEGCSGKSVIKGAFRQTRQAYSERIDGVRLLTSCKPEVIAQNSPSFARLHEQLAPVVSTCRWLEPNEQSAE